MANDSMRDILGPGGVISKRLPGYEARPPQIAMAETVAAAIEARQHAVVEGGTGVGKALDVDTPIATPTGWTRMGDLRAGDTVFDETGVPTRVVQAFDVMHDRPCYEIEFSDRSTLVADEEHEWITHTWSDRKRASRRREAEPRHKNFADTETLKAVQSLLDSTCAGDMISVTEAVKLLGGHRYSVWRATQGVVPAVVKGQQRSYARAALLASVLSRLQKDVDDRRPDSLPFSRLTTRALASTLTIDIGATPRLNHAVPVAQALKLPDAELPMDPFVLGTWLGDGASATAQLTTADPELVHEIEGAGYVVRKLKAKYLYSLHLASGPARSRWEPGLIGILRDVGVLNNKHIPLCYLRSSEGQRRALLAGLLDTDGTVSPNGAVQYTSINPRLARDVHALVLSLGYRPSIMTKAARLYGKECGTAYTITFTTTDQMFRLPRKVAAHHERSHNYSPARNGFRYITAVRPVPSRPVRCIQVTATSHLYLAGDSLIPTHNSLAYLIPAIYSGKKVIVSTANKALQDQLVAKDIPFLQHALPRDVTAALVKGRANYLCLDHFEHEDAFQTMSGRNRDYQALKQWSTRTRTGDFEELEVLPSRDLLARVSSTARSCTGNACPSFGYCYVERMRDRAERVGIVVCNHALLLADLVLRDLGAHLLPDRDLIIVDEAHRLEDAALNALTVSLGRRDIAELVESALLQRHAGSRTASELLTLADDLFRPFETAPARNRAIMVEELAAALRLSEALDEIHEQLVRHNPYKDLTQPTPESRHYERLLEWTDRLTLDSRVIGRIHDEDCVRYVEYGLGVRSREATLKWTPVDVAEPLERLLFKQTPVICTSATLAVGDFAYFRRSVGIAEAVEFVAPSPFDYAAQCLLYVPAHLPEFRTAATPAYTEALCDELERLVRASGGRAFLLFTSYRGLEEAYTQLCERLPYPLLKQGELPRAELLRRFRAEGDTVLFATKSFWEGVDVVGEALSLVVIDRVPFGVPDDPIIATRVARLKREEGDWFNDLMLPTAILQLKQGFGRLIRSGRDRGVVALLDSRIAHKGYGRRIVEALPPARLVHHIEQVEEFFAAESH